MKLEDLYHAKRSFTKDDIRKFAEEENVRYLRLQFTDILGTIKMLKFQ